MEDWKNRVEGFDMDKDYYPENENALLRVAHLPIVNSTWCFVHAYYSNVKESYPSVTPYLEVAENITSAAANLALTTSKPVVDKYGPVLNGYANKGLDTIEDKVPLILREPKEILNQTKESASCFLMKPVDNALGATEKCVDYYLPSDEEIEEQSSDDDSDCSSDDYKDLKNKYSKKTSERIHDISMKIRKRSYQHAMKHWHGVRIRSQMALSNLNFTVDLIQYAQTGIANGLQQSVIVANETLSGGLETARSTLNSATVTINEQLEKKVLAHAQNITRQLNETCQVAFKHISSSPQMENLFLKAKSAKESAEELYVTFANKTSISEISVSLVSASRLKLKSVEESLLNVLDVLSDQPPISWLTPDCNVDPLGGIVMEEIEEQLYGRPADAFDDIPPRQPRSRSTSGDRKKG